MNVHDVIDLGEGHLIEFGEATWDNQQPSVRNRYPTATGGFNPHSSSEVPIGDVCPIVVETLRRDALTPEETMAVLQAAVDSVRRRLR